MMATTRWPLLHPIIQGLLLYITSLADAAQQSTQVLVDGYAMGSLSMTCFALGCHEIAARGTGEAPPPPHVPADESNL